MKFGTTPFSWSYFNNRCLAVCLLSVCVLGSSLSLRAQDDVARFEELEHTEGAQYFLWSQGLFSCSSVSPSFFRDNSWGRYSTTPTTLNYGLGVGYATSLGVWHNQDLHLSTGFALDGDGVQSTSIESAYVALNYGSFQVLLGKRIQEEGGLDRLGATLSLGDLLFSSNARPIPQLSFSVRRYTTLPYTASHVAVRGGLRHLWMGDNYGVEDSYMLHVFGGIRLRFLTHCSVDYEVHHAAQWGGWSEQYGSLGNSFSDYIQVLLSQRGGNIASEQVNLQGNHVVMQLLRLNYSSVGEHFSWAVSSYWEQIAEDGPVRFMAHAMNVPDGLFGTSLKFFGDSYQFTLLYEYLCTSDQSGPWHDKDGLVFGGNDNYYNNAIYSYGWSYQGRGLGNPLVVSPADYLALHDKVAKALSQDLNYAHVFFLNRVQAQHVALDFRTPALRTRLSYTSSVNYGSYSLSEALNLHQYTLGLQCSYALPAHKAWRCSLALATDWGNLQGRNQGISLGVSYLGTLF